MNDLPRLKIGSDIEIKIPVYITDRYIHILLMGKSGTGKSTSITNWWETDHIWKNAKVLVDPSGFLSRDAYSISGGMYCSQDSPISINPMRYSFTESQVSDLIAEAVNQVISITTPNQPFTVKMRSILDEAVKYCLNHNRKSLLNVLDYIKNLNHGNTETKEGITSRLTFLLSDKRMEKILCGNNSVDWGELIRNKRTFILDCSGMGIDKMIFLGTLVTNGIVNDFRYSRHKEFPPVSLYIDEAHCFVNPNLFTILKEGRRYRISCVLATQDFAVIDERMARVMLNVGNIVSYRLGHREASYVARELDMMPQGLQFMEKYNVAYLTPKRKGIAKAPRPVWIIPKEPPEMVEPQRKTKPSWFPLESYQPDQTTT